jgi:hypothetical protein
VLNEDIKATQELVNNGLNDKKYDKYCQLYSFTTENIKGYYEQLDFNNKETLTICASIFKYK